MNIMNVIDLVVDDGRVLVWNVDDLLKIRQEHRVVGQLLGSLVNFSYQEKHRGLPLSLLKEEVNLLVEKGFARLVQVPAIKQKPSKEAVERFKEHREQSYHKQVAIYKEGREKQLRSMLDRIVEGKQNKRRQRMLSSGTGTTLSRQPKKPKTEDNKEDVMVLEDDNTKLGNLDPAALLQEEVDKIEPIPRENIQVTTFYVSPFIDAVPMADPPWEYPSNKEEYLRYRVYRDIWEKGFYVTPGHNFGGDFLVYPGDPVLFHAQYIVRCVGHKDPISAIDLIAFSRLSVSVRKRAVLASLKPVSDDEEDSEVVAYQSVSWSNRHEHAGTKLPCIIKSKLKCKS